MLNRQGVSKEITPPRGGGRGGQRGPPRKPSRDIKRLREISERHLNNPVKKERDDSSKALRRQPAPHIGALKQRSSQSRMYYDESAKSLRHISFRQSFGRIPVEGAPTGAHHDVVGYQDMIKCDKISMGAIIGNLEQRFNKSLPYTYVSNILVSVNPMRPMPQLYGTSVIRQYRGQRMGALPPHLFAIAEASYSSLINQGADQSIVISGESGSGKSESTKLILQYLSGMSTNQSNMETKILESVPLLEAFGNARTVHNDNSSRFGKFLLVQFDCSGNICGAKVTQYLLEKSRVHQLATSERNYHIFYQLCAGATAEEREKYSISDAADYAYLNGGNCTSIGGVSDKQEWADTLEAFSLLDISPVKQEGIVRLLSAVLNIGNVTFTADPEGALVPSVCVQAVASLLGLPFKALARSLTQKVIRMRSEAIVKPRSEEQAVEAVHATAKALYQTLFLWMVDRMNSSTVSPSAAATIGILDVFGFENFAVNRFEQLCINYANEALQLLFNEYVFVAEEAEYRAQGISFTFVDFKTNTECMALIEQKPVGILSLLDQFCRMPNGTDQALLDAMYQEFANHSHFTRPRMQRAVFIVQHYAGPVEYDVEDFLNKNKDVTPDELKPMLERSQIPFIVEIGSRVDSLQYTTTASYFKSQLTNLMNELRSTNTQWVRCFKPNREKRAGVFDADVLQEQLLNSGMLETCKIRKMGYPVRHTFRAFLGRYIMLIDRSALEKKSPREACEFLLKGQGALVQGDESRPSWQLGDEKVFLSSEAASQLDTARDKILQVKVRTIQRRWKRFVILNKWEKLVGDVLKEAERRRVAEVKERREREEAERKKKEECEKAKREEEARKKKQAEKEKQRVEAARKRREEEEEAQRAIEREKDGLKRQALEEAVKKKKTEDDAAAAAEPRQREADEERADVNAPALQTGEGDEEVDLSNEYALGMREILHARLDPFTRLHKLWQLEGLVKRAAEVDAAIQPTHMRLLAQVSLALDRTMQELHFRIQTSLGVTAPTNETAWLKEKMSLSSTYLESVLDVNKHPGVPTSALPKTGVLPSPAPTQLHTKVEPIPVAKKRWPHAAAAAANAAAAAAAPAAKRPAGAPGKLVNPFEPRTAAPAGGAVRQVSPSKQPAGAAQPLSPSKPPGASKPQIARIAQNLQLEQKLKTSGVAPPGVATKHAPSEVLTTKPLTDAPHKPPPDTPANKPPLLNALSCKAPLPGAPKRPPPVKGPPPRPLSPNPLEKAEGVAVPDTVPDEEQFMEEPLPAAIEFPEATRPRLECVTKTRPMAKGRRPPGKKR